MVDIRNVRQCLSGNFELDPEEFGLLLKINLIECSGLSQYHRENKIHILPLCSSPKLEDCNFEQNKKIIHVLWEDEYLGRLVTSGLVKRLVIPYFTKEKHYIHFEIDFMGFNDDPKVGKVIFIKAIDPSGKNGDDVKLAASDIEDFFNRKKEDGTCIAFSGIREVMIGSEFSNTQQQNIKEERCGSGFYVIYNILQFSKNLDYRIVSNTEQALFKFDQIALLLGTYYKLNDYEIKIRDGLLKDQLRSSSGDQHLILSDQDVSEFSSAISHEKKRITREKEWSEKLKDIFLDIKEAAEEFFKLSGNDFKMFNLNSKIFFIIKKEFIDSSWIIAVLLKERGVGGVVKIEDYQSDMGEEKYNLCEIILEKLEDKIIAIKKINAARAKQKFKRKYLTTLAKIVEVEEPKEKSSEELLLEKRNTLLDMIQRSANELFSTSRCGNIFKWNNDFELVIRDSDRKGRNFEIIFKAKNNDSEEYRVDKDLGCGNAVYEDILQFLNFQILISCNNKVEFGMVKRQTPMVRALPEIKIQNNNTKKMEFRSNEFNISEDTKPIDSKLSEHVSKINLEQSNRGIFPC